MFLANGSEFHGSFKAGRMNGVGTYTYGDGSRYVGEFKDDKRHGRGVFSYFSGDRYDGEWVEDKRHGQGTLTFHNDDVYHGRHAPRPMPAPARACSSFYALKRTGHMASGPAIANDDPCDFHGTFFRAL